VLGQTAENSLKALKKEADERLLVEAAQKDLAINSTRSSSKPEQVNNKAHPVKSARRLEN